jgi:hypothetical protein
MPKSRFGSFCGNTHKYQTKVLSFARSKSGRHIEIMAHGGTAGVVGCQT